MSVGIKMPKFSMKDEEEHKDEPMRLTLTETRPRESDAERSSHRASRESAPSGDAAPRPEAGPLFSFRDEKEAQQENGVNGAQDMVQVQPVVLVDIDIPLKSMAFLLLKALILLIPFAVVLHFLQKVVTVGNF